MARFDTLFSAVSSNAIVSSVALLLLAEKLLEDSADDVELIQQRSVVDDRLVVTANREIIIYLVHMNNINLQHDCAQSLSNLREGTLFNCIHEIFYTSASLSMYLAINSYQLRV